MFLPARLSRIPQPRAPAHLAEKCAAFLRSFQSPAGDGFKYLNMLQEIADRQRETLDVDLSDLEEHCSSDAAQLRVDAGANNMGGATLDGYLGADSDDETERGVVGGAASAAVRAMGDVSDDEDGGKRKRGGGGGGGGGGKARKLAADGRSASRGGGKAKPKKKPKKRPKKK